MKREVHKNIVLTEKISGRRGVGRQTEIMLRQKMALKIIINIIDSEHLQLRYVERFNDDGGLTFVESQF